MMNTEQKVKAQARLKRVAGQVAGIQRMVEDDRYCVDVMTQISAARAALAKVSAMLLEAHVNTCVAETFRSEDPDDRAQKVAELIKLFDKHCGC